MLRLEKAIYATIFESMNDLFSFPNPVNEKAARVVAGTVLLMVITILITSWYWLLFPLAYGFGHVY